MAKILYYETALYSAKMLIKHDKAEYRAFYSEVP